MSGVQLKTKYTIREAKLSDASFVLFGKQQIWDIKYAHKTVFQITAAIELKRILVACNEKDGITNFFASSKNFLQRPLDLFGTC